MGRLIRSLHAFRRLSRAERGIFVQAWFLLPLAAFSLFLLGYRLSRTLLIPKDSGARRQDPTAAQSLALIVQSAARWNPVPTRCLARSLVACSLLQRQGLVADLCIGVARPGGQFAAHAWVEHGGIALLESEVIGSSYALLDRRRNSEGETLKGSI